jgi:hypothetical protein
MSRTRRLGVIAASVLISLGGLLGLTGGPASASPSTATCAADDVLAITSAKYVFMWDRVTWFHDGPGGKVTGDVQKQRQISASISFGADISVGFLVEESKISITTAITKTVQTTFGHHYEHLIPATKYGNLKYGAWGYSVSWVDEYRHSNCKITVRQRGTGVVPTVAVGWYYFITNS